MSSRNNRKVCVLFEKDFKTFKKQTYSWIKTEQAEKIIKDGNGFEYNPTTKKKVADSTTKKAEQPKATKKK